MKKIFISLAVVLALVAVMAVPAMAAEEGTLPASVSVNEVISITLTDEAPDGITFGAVDQSSTGNSDQVTGGFSDTKGSVTVAVDSGTNVNVDMKISGTDFDTSWPISNAKYSLTHTDTKVAMSTTPTVFASNVVPGGSQMLWHWLDVPSGITAGDYSSTFTYTVVKTVA